MQIGLQEEEQLDSGWLIILVVWGSFFVFLGVYLGLCYFFGSSINARSAADFPADLFRYSLFGISLLTIFGVYFLRRLLLDTSKSTTYASSSSSQHPAVSKYIVAVTVSSAMLESIAIYGVVLFLMTKESLSFYLLTTISAAALIYFRPRKEELFDLARNMKKLSKNQRV